MTWSSSLNNNKVLLDLSTWKSSEADSESSPTSSIIFFETSNVIKLPVSFQTSLHFRRREGPHRDEPGQEIGSRSHGTVYSKSPNGQKKLLLDTVLNIHDVFRTYFAVLSFSTTTCIYCSDICWILTAVQGL